MKIYTPPETVRFVSTTDRDSSGDSYQGTKREKRKNPYTEQKAQVELSVVEITDERLDEALLAFQKDSQAKGQGIAAEKAPGLRVVLKDHEGAIIRLCSGEEFLKMQEAVVEGRASGKLIDQKA